MNVSAELSALYTIIVSILLFCTYLLVMHLTRGKIQNPVQRIVSQRLGGLLLLGVIPLGIIWPTNERLIQLTFKSPDTINLLFTILIALPVILLTNYKLSKNTSHREQYPEIRVGNWKTSLYIINSLSWAAYLLGYEFLFRGILLHSCIEAWGTFVAILINTLLYALAHLHKGRFETLGSIPLGILFCGISIWTHSFTTVFVLHCLIALSNDFFCIKSSTDLLPNH
ncbi:CPBP family intramembrane glutamic endopeptidase [Saccharicrinis sp. GN24d3]|uniref:CPBP family intramembrane glutamic endopeptidase n=1 Tax=Saccharicrinis sp. GN24d3 TaxID=3458416 RepID=UPI0040359BFF